MRDLDLGFYLVMAGILLAALFENTVATTIGCFMAGVGFGFINRDKG